MPARSAIIKRKTQGAALFSVMPLVIILSVNTVYPTLDAAIHSLTKWDGLNSDYIGLENYVRILSDHQTWRLLLNNILFIFSVPVQIVIGLVLAMLLYEKTPGWKLFRSLFFLPNVLSTIVIGLLFKQAFMYDGPVNEFLRVIGLEKMAIEWLAKGPTAMGVLIVSIIWTNFGYGVVLFLAGMATIDTSIIEASIVDGANWVQKTFAIVLPMIARMIEFFSVTTIIWMFTGLFGYIFAITKGGPGYSTTPLEYMIYLKAFKSGSQMGYACALAIFLLAITFGVSRLQMLLSGKVEDVA